MDQLVREMEHIDIKKIKYHVHEVDKLCNKRNMIINRTAKRHHEKTKGNKIKSKKENNNCICGNYIMKAKYWINYTNVEEEEE